MNRALGAIQTELFKLRKSKMFWITLGAFSFAPLMGGLFMIILKDPILAQNNGLIGAKAKIIGETSWPSYLNLLSQILAIGGIVIFGFVTSWIFGREYSDRTIKDLIALPFPRRTIILAKFFTAFVANMALALYIIAFGIILGLIIILPDWSITTLVEGLYTLIVTTLLTVLLSTPVALFACLGRGYLAPLGFVILMVVFSQILATIGYGAYFPWAIPALYSGIDGTSESIGLLSFTLVILISIIGLTTTFIWWRISDHR